MREQIINLISMYLGKGKIFDTQYYYFDSEEDNDSEEYTDYESDGEIIPLIPRSNPIPKELQTFEDFYREQIFFP